jgi:hypothetical protein
MAKQSLPESNPLRQLVRTWTKKFEAAIKYKKPFSDDAKEASMFFDGDHNWMWKDSYARGEKGYNSNIAPPGFRVQVNRVFELVDIFGSVIYHRNPVRTVTLPKQPDLPPEAYGLPEDPMMMTPEQQQLLSVAASDAQGRISREMARQLLDAYLNLTPQMLDLKRQARKYVNEGLIKGRGVMWPELVELDTAGEQPIRVVGSFYDSVDNLLTDPDFDNFDDIQWCARRCIRPLEEVAEEYGVPESDLEKHLDGSAEIKADNEPRSNKKKQGQTQRLVTYYKVWTKCGLGDRFKDAPKESRGIFDGLGRYCYLVICEGVDYPLNLPPSVMQEEVEEETGLPQSVLLRTAWPVPYYVDPGGWPFVPLDFHPKPGYSWPISHIKPGVGELRLMNWGFSFLATRIATSCETIIAVQKAADQELKDQLLAPSEGGFKVIELAELLGRRIEDVISTFQLPQVTRDLWDILQAVAEEFSKRTGLTELIHGFTTGMFRSAAEATIKQENVAVRPDAMANELEDSMSTLARREALAARWLLEPQDVAPFLGPMGAIAWESHVSKRDVASLTRDFLFRVEAGSARKPNKATKVEQMAMAVQTLGPILAPLAGSGMVAPFNALMKDWANSLDIDAAPYLIPPPPPPPEAPLGLPSPPPDPQAASAAGEADLPPDLPPEAVPQQIPPELQV